MAQSLSGDVERDGKGGLMTMVMPNSQVESDRAVTEELTFEPWDMLHALARDDVVLLMRHGPTDWSKRDATDVAPTDCEDQRVTTETGRRQMYELGALMVANHLTPGRIVASEWCRNQQTLEAMLDGMRDADPDALENVQIDTIADLNLLLSLQGAPDVAAMREIIADWDGGAGHGPLLIISHFTNIQELTERAVFEGQMLVLDPADGNRVLGQLRLRSAQPDVGHFQ
ncbi:SixA phosphatase family protein [Jannaschia seosinensis]|nr:histidine phosphatase family protein [Jannaschia seosinensis]